MVWLSNVLFLVAGIGLTIVMVEHLSAVRHLRERPPTPKGTPGISILKPLCGIDDDLEANLACFAELDYPNYEVLLGLKSVDDPAHAVARAAAGRWPRIFRLVMQRGEPGLNAKVNQLLTLEPEARHELLLISDSNVRVGAGYLSEIAALFERPETGLVTHPIIGVGDETLGALFDRLHLASLVTPGMISGKRIAGQDFVVGKSMAMRRGDLAAMGGFESVKDVLAEDFILGSRVGKQLGKRTEVGHQPVVNVSHQLGVGDLFLRYTRWNVIQRRLIGRFLFSFQLLLNPVALGLLGLFACPTRHRLVAFLLLALTKILADAGSRTVQERSPIRLRHLVFTPVKDLLIFGSWLRAMVTNEVVWRGNRLRVLAGTRLEPIRDPKPEVRPEGL